MKLNHTGDQNGVNDITFSSQSSNSRGVAILFRNTFQNHIEKEIKDSDRNFIILSVRFNDALWTLVAVYGPNNDEPQFFCKSTA